MTARRAAVFLAAAAMVAAGPALGESEVRFPGEDGAEIRALEFRPAGAGPFPAIVMLHGCSGFRTPGGRLSPLYRFWTGFARDRGYLALLPDSFASRGSGPVCAVAERTIRPERERRDDAFAAARYLGRRPDVKGGEILLMGWSHGAATTLAAVDGARPGAATAPAFKAALAFYPGCGLWRRQGLAARVPLTVLIGDADDWTPAASCRAMAEASRAAAIRLIVYPGAHHAFDHPNLPLTARIARNAAWREGQRTVHVGTDPAARAAAIREVEDFLAPSRR